MKKIPSSPFTKCISIGGVFCFFLACGSTSVKTENRQYKEFSIQAVEIKNAMIDSFNIYQSFHWFNNSFLIERIPRQLAAGLLFVFCIRFVM